MEIPSKYDELEDNMWTCLFHDASSLNGETRILLMKNYIFVKNGVTTYFFFYKMGNQVRTKPLK